MSSISIPVSRPKALVFDKCPVPDLPKLPLAVAEEKTVARLSSRNAIGQNLYQTYAVPLDQTGLQSNPLQKLNSQNISFCNPVFLPINFCNFLQAGWQNYKTKIYYISKLKAREIYCCNRSVMDYGNSFRATFLYVMYLVQWYQGLVQMFSLRASSFLCESHLVDISAPKKNISPPPQKIPQIRCRHPPSPSAPPILEAPLRLPGLFNKNRSPPPALRRIDSPSPSPSRKK